MRMSEAAGAGEKNRGGGGELKPAAIKITLGVS